MFGSRKFNGQKYLHFWISSRPDSENSTNYNSNINRISAVQEDRFKQLQISLCLISSPDTFPFTQEISDNRSEDTRNTCCFKFEDIWFKCCYSSRISAQEVEGYSYEFRIGVYRPGSYLRRRQTRTDIIFYKAQIWKL